MITSTVFLTNNSQISEKKPAPLKICDLFSIRIPKDSTRKALWIQAIEKFQKFDNNRQRFHVCQRHFQESDFNQKNNKKELKGNAVPSIFLSSTIENGIQESSDHGLEQVVDASVGNNETGCKSCGFLNAKISELEHELLSTRTAHNIEKQRLEHKIYLLENAQEKLGDKFQEKREELKHEINENIRIRDLLAELRKGKYISEDDERFFNVSFIVIFLIFSFKFGIGFL